MLGRSHRVATSQKALRWRRRDRACAEGPDAVSRRRRKQSGAGQDRECAEGWEKPGCASCKLPLIDLCYKDHSWVEKTDIALLPIGHISDDIAIFDHFIFFHSSRQGVWVSHGFEEGGLPFDLRFMRRYQTWINNVLPGPVSRWMLKKYDE
ncbi:unnamed protein product [Ranitomeya imitator]|uniref:Flavin-containing monooxygenase n=1 Tax=Ranitomeya imitator TaxID=111125 RepID=A0ABN9LH82_9NEOB|nr:unnamed protein product [Ranitomeya imitator]